jgi:histidinol phosphatase-like enzyme (inositol monophosphatase family)
MTAPTAPPLAEYLAFANNLAQAAGDITLKYFRTSLTVERKGDDSPVTIADRETEQFIRREIERAYPTHGILGEEYGSTNAQAALQWIIDPIDGTQSFIHGVPLYTVLIALEIEGEASLGVIHCPPLRETVAAATGLGCTYNGLPCHVSQTAALEQARVQVTDYASLMHYRPGFSDRLLKSTSFCRSWADAYGYMLVATGRADVMLDPIMNLWDTAPLKPIIEEAGGRFSDLDGNPTIHNPSALATNGLLHPAILALND